MLLASLYVLLLFHGSSGVVLGALSLSRSEQFDVFVEGRVGSTGIEGRYKGCDAYLEYPMMLQGVRYTCGLMCKEPSNPELDTPDLHTPPSVRPFAYTLLVENDTEYPIHAIWKGFKVGSETIYATIPPRNVEALKTYETHVWVFREKGSAPNVCGQTVGVWDGLGVWPKPVHIVTVSSFTKTRQEIHCKYS